MPLSTKLITKNLNQLNKLSKLAGISRSYSSLPGEFVPEEKYIPGKHGYAEGFGVPLLRAKKAAKNTKKESKEGNEQKTNLNSTTETDPSKLSTIKQFRLEMAKIREQYREEAKLLEQKQKDETLKKIQNEQKEIAEKKHQVIEKVKSIQLRRQLDQLSSPNVLEGTPLAEVDPKHAFSTIGSFKITPEYIEKRDQLRQSNRQKNLNEKQRERMEVLLELFYQSQTFITPENFDEQVTNALRNIVPMVSSYAFSDSTAETLRFTSDQRKQQILDALEGTTHAGRPSFRQIQEFEDKA